MKRIITILILLICTATFGQDTVKTYKTFNSKHFAVNDTILAPKIYFSLSGGQHVIYEHRDSVKIIADFLIANPSVEIEVGLHMDYRGNAEANAALSQRRALNLKSLLVEHFKISPYRIQAVGYGEAVPIIPEEKIKSESSQEIKEELHAINRRVEIIILKK